MTGTAPQHPGTALDGEPGGLAGARHLGSVPGARETGVAWHFALPSWRDGGRPAAGGGAELAGGPGRAVRVIAVGGDGSLNFPRDRVV